MTDVRFRRQPLPGSDKGSNIIIPCQILADGGTNRPPRPGYHYFWSILIHSTTMSISLQICIHRPLRSSRRERRVNLSFHFLLSPAKEQRDVNKGRK